MNDIIHEAESKFLKVTIKKKIITDNKLEASWITDDIKKEISIRRQIKEKIY